jgi:hypothetical protein
MAGVLLEEGNNGAEGSKGLLVENTNNGLVRNINNGLVGNINNGVIVGEKHQQWRKFSILSGSWGGWIF